VAKTPKKKEDEATRRNNQVVATNRKARHNYSTLLSAA
jgi:SsrA-binding protein